MNPQARPHHPPWLPTLLTAAVLLAVSATPIRLWALWNEAEQARYLRGEPGANWDHLVALVLPPLVGALWPRCFPSEGRKALLAWPAMLAVALWWLLLLVFLLWSFGPVLAGIGGVPSTPHTKEERLGAASWLALPGLLGTWACARLLLSRRLGGAPSVRAAGAVLGVCALLGFGVPAVVHARRLRDHIEAVSAAQGQAERQARIRDLGGYGYAGARERLLQIALEGGPDTHEALLALSRLPDGRRAVASVARDQSVIPIVRVQAVSLTMWLTRGDSRGEEWLLGPLVGFLSAEDGDLRLAMVEGVVVDGWRDQSLPLLRRALQDPDQRVRIQAAGRLSSEEGGGLLACGVVGDPASSRLLRDKDFDCGLYLCGASGDPGAPAVLTRIANDPTTPAGRRDAAERFEDYLRNRRPGSPGFPLWDPPPETVRLKEGCWSKGWW